MNETYSHETLRDAYECGRKDALTDGLSETPTPKSTGPLTVVVSDGVVGLRVASAEAHWLMLHAEARACDELAERNQADYDRGWNHGMAQAYRIRANWLQDICRQAGYEIPRQPEPNNKMSNSGA